jgi:2'-5' RNA ligase
MGAPTGQVNAGSAASDDRIRCFVGIAAADMGLEAALAARIADGQQYIDSQQVRWTPVPFLHLTLCFLGAQPREVLERLSVMLGKALVDVSGFPIELTHCCCFPDATSRILAAIPERGPALLTLQQRVAQVVAEAGIVLENRPFLPHVTLGRLTRHHTQPDFNEPMQATGEVSAVSLYQSEALDSGSHYTVVARWPLLTSPIKLPRVPDSL